MKPAPLLFIGHGSPMNALADNSFTRSLRQYGESIPKPTAILMISAHWYTHGSIISTAENPVTIHDFRGFPQDLFDIRYPAPGHPETALHIQTVVQSGPVFIDTDRGLDHGAWSILRHLYPDADVPVLQLSIDKQKSWFEHVVMARELQFLRYQNIMVIGSGNLVHNLRTANFEDRNANPAEWAVKLDNQLTDIVLNNRVDDLFDIRENSEIARLGIADPDHFIPLFYFLGLLVPGEKPDILYRGFEHETISLTSFKTNKIK